MSRGLNTNTTNKYMKMLHAKGWSGAKVAERWNISRRHLGTLCDKPKKMFIDAIAGLPPGPYSK